MSDYETAPDSLIAKLAEIRPAWILASFIVLGYVVGVAGEFSGVCKTGIGCNSFSDLLAQNNQWVISYHTEWELVSSIFVTPSFFDAGFNALAVLILDRFLDTAFNKPRFFVIFFLTAILGNIFSLLGNPRIYSSAGASGGIFGLFAASFSYSWASQRKIDKATLFFFLGLFVTSSFIGGVDYIAHFGGSLGGFICGPILHEILKKRLSRYESVAASSPVGLVLSTALIGAIVMGSILQFLIFLLM